MEELHSTASVKSPGYTKYRGVVHLLGRYSWLIAGFIAFLIFLSTLQVTINGSGHPYMTDVGEIQNALPRWGTIHFPGYPLYSLTGSTFVTVLRSVGIEPAASASLLSAIWGALAIAMLVLLQQAYNVRPVIAIIAAILYALSTSFWVDASIAEVHTLTMFLFLGSVYFAVRFGRTGEKKELMWLALFASQAVLHQRAMVFMGLGLIILIAPQLKNLLRYWMYVFGIVFVGALVYLYLPLRDLQGVEWTFDQPGTWQGFWSLVLDTKTDRIISFPKSITEWVERARGVISVLAGEWPLALVVIGLAGNAVGTFLRNRREAPGMFLLWFPFVILSFVIWVGWIGDALLAVNLPVIAMAAFGLGLLASIFFERSPRLGTAASILLAVLAIALFLQGRTKVNLITKDNGAEAIIIQAEEFQGTGLGDSMTTLMALWGNDYWSLAYAKEYQNRLQDLNLVDHNADLGSIMNGEGRLITLAQTFYLRPLSWWDQRFGKVYLASESNNLVEIDNSPPYDQSQVTQRQNFRLGNGILIRRADVKWQSANQLSLTIYWEAQDAIDTDYSVAVHLVAEIKPDGPEDILTQSDRQHPVSGWYPTSRWSAGEIIKDEYLIDVPLDADPAAIRLSMYQQEENGSFLNSRWMSIEIEERDQVLD